MMCVTVYDWVLIVLVAGHGSYPVGLWRSGGWVQGGGLLEWASLACRLAQVCRGVQTLLAITHRV
jgi:hypothetical protein